MKAPTTKVFPIADAGNIGSGVRTPDPTLVGDVVTNVTSATADSKGMVTILVKAEGIWVFQFDQAKKAALARLIAGKSRKDAQALLAQQDGVAQVGKIDVSNTSDDLLPTDPKQITIVVQNVPGLKATPTSVAGTPTPSPTRGSPVPRPTGTPPGK